MAVVRKPGPQMPQGTNQYKKLVLAIKWIRRSWRGVKRAAKDRREDGRLALDPSRLALSSPAPSRSA